MSKRKSHFIKQSNIVHKGKYDYSLVNYVNNKTKVNIICPIHGEFTQLPKNHIRGNGCLECKNDTISMTKYDFVLKGNEKNGNKYDYSKVNYINNKTKVDIICKKHDIFSQTPSSHLDGRGCPKCFIERKKKSIEDFISESNVIHKGKYDYSKVIYVNNSTKVIINCPIHGDFKQMPYKHLQSRGCPKCKRSKGELKISKWLDNNNIKYEEQKSFDDLIYKSKLKCDFYLPSYNLIIEYNGIQHYKVVEHFGGSNKFEDVKLRDSIKEEYFKENNIKLLIIKYTDFDNIDEILNKYIYG